MAIYFVTRSGAARWQDIARLDRSVAEREPDRFRSGIDGWIAWSYLLLRDELSSRTGMSVHFSDRLAPGHICIAHRDDLNAFGGWHYRCYTVAIRADRPPVYAAHWVIDQNPLHPQPGHRYLPFWPVPGLLGRDANRGSEIRKLCHIGRDGAAPEWFDDPGFHADLQALGVSFEVRTQRWYDYSDVDLALGYRHEAPTMLAFKPASKLINAWLAEVPALLGPEPAYENLRRSQVDYLPVDSAHGVVAQVKYLQAHREIYRAMIANGIDRGAEFSTEAVRKMWLDWLCEEVLPGYLRWRRGHMAGINPIRLAGFVGQVTAQKLAAKSFRGAVARELTMLAQRQRDHGATLR
jgi:hypothetical protein